MFDRRFIMAGLGHDTVPEAAVDNAVRTSHCPLSKELEVSLLEKITECWIRHQTGQEAVSPVRPAIGAKLARCRLASCLQVSS